MFIAGEVSHGLCSTTTFVAGIRKRLVKSARGIAPNKPTPLGQIGNWHPKSTRSRVFAASRTRPATLAADCTRVSRCTCGRSRMSPARGAGSIERMPTSRRAEVLRQPHMIAVAASVSLQRSRRHSSHDACRRIATWCRARPKLAACDRLADWHRKGQPFAADLFPAPPPARSERSCSSERFRNRLSVGLDFIGIVRTAYDSHETNGWNSTIRLPWLAIGHGE
jgi:hypothetical protein